jgi:hypothetical protein
MPDVLSDNGQRQNLGTQIHGLHPLTHVSESFDPRSENLAQFTDRDIIQKFLQPIEQILFVDYLNIF